MRPLLAILLLGTGCVNPISNRVFYEDAAYVSALPSSERFRAPKDVRLARVGTSEVLEAAVLSAAELEDLTLLIAGSGEALRGSVPEERSAVLRGWGPVSAAARIDGHSRLWYVRGSVLRPEEGGDLEWVIEGSADGRPPWVPLGEGLHDPSGRGEGSWDLGAHLGLVGLQDRLPAGVIALSWDDGGFDGDQPAVQYAVEGPGLPKMWRTGGRVALTWTGSFQLTGDGGTWPGIAQVVHLPGEGGRALGALQRAGDPIAWEACWDSVGDAVYQAGDADVVALGHPSACPFPSPF